MINGTDPALTQFAGHGPRRRRWRRGSPASVLRIETTVNDPKPFKVVRTKITDPEGEKSRQPLRRTVADLQLRAQASQAVNNRYAEALASIEVDDQLSVLLALLRAHRLIRRLPRSHRYVLTTKGHSVATAILAIQSSRIKSLLQEAA